MNAEEIKDNTNGTEANDGPPRIAKRRWKQIVIPAIAMLMIVSGFLSSTINCQQPNYPTFPREGGDIVWPLPPDTPRIKYIGQITGERSLGIKKSGWKQLGEVFTGPSPTIEFSTPMAVVARGDKVYVADGQAQAVYVLDLNTKKIETVREGAGRSFEWPIDVTLTDTGFAVADSRRGGVYLFDGNNRFVRSIGESALQRPSSVTWRADAKELWVVDTAAHACVIFNESGNRLRSIGGRGGSEAKFNYPAGIAFSRNGAIVADSMNFRVQLVSESGDSRGVFGNKGDGAGDFAMPRDVAVDSMGHLYVLDNQFENVQIFEPSGQLLMALGRGGDGVGEFNLPSGVSIDERDRIWIADTYNRRIQVFQFLRETTP